MFYSLHYASQICRSGVGAPVVGDLDGEYRHDSRKNILEWCLPVIDENNKSGSLEFSIAGRPNDFFPVNVSFVSKRNYSNIEVSCSVWDISPVVILMMKLKKKKSHEKQISFPVTVGGQSDPGRRGQPGEILHWDFLCCRQVWDTLKTFKRNVSSLPAYLCNSLDTVQPVCPNF